MRLWIISDLHQEFSDVAWRPKNTPRHDALIAAGDIAGSPTASMAFLRTLTDQPIVYVLGNHEFYRSSLQDGILEARHAASSQNVVFLENGLVSLGGIRILGATLWTDFALFGNPVLGMFDGLTMVADYEEIQGSDGDLHPSETLERHQGSVSWLKSALSLPFEGPTVVVSHRAAQRISPPSLPAGFRVSFFREPSA